MPCTANTTLVLGDTPLGLELYMYTPLNCMSIHTCFRSSQYMPVRNTMDII